MPGVRMIFYSGDHDPPHFHASRPGDWSAKVHFLEDRARMFRDIRPKNATINPPDRRAIIEGVEEHREELLKEWEACH